MGERMFRNIKIGARLALAFGVVLLLVAGLGVYVSTETSNINTKIDLVVQDRMVKSRQANDMIDQVNLTARVVRNVFLARSPEEAKKEASRMTATAERMSGLLDSLNTSVKDEQGIKLLSEVQDARKGFLEGRQKMLSLFDAGQKDAAVDMLFGDFRDIQARYVKALDEFANYQEGLARTDGEAVGATVHSLRMVLIVLVAFLVLLSMSIAWILSRSINRPLSHCITQLDSISRGEIPETSSSESWGEFETMRQSLNNCVEGLQGLVEAEHVLQRMAINDYTVKVEGAYKGIFARVGEATNTAQSRVLNAIRMIQKIAAGDFEAELVNLKQTGKRSEQDTLIPSYIQAMESIKALVDDTSKLGIEVAQNGNTKFALDVSRHQGSYAQVMRSLNDTVETLVTYLNATSDFVGHIGRGEIPPRRTKEVKGDFSVLQSNLNTCIDGLQGLVEADKILQLLAVNDLTRSVEGSYNGIYARIAEATNTVRERLHSAIAIAHAIAIGDFTEKYEEVRRIGKRSENDTFLPAFFEMMVAIKGLIEDADMLAKAAVEGHLATRADASRHQGDYRKIVQGVNNTLDAVIGPINEATVVLERVAARDLTARVEGDYVGDLAKIKTAINTAVDNLDQAMGQVTDSTAQVASASGQISSGSQNLAQGANEQASSLEEVSASLEEMSSMTRQNAENAMQAKNLSTEADQNAKSGSEAMGRMSQSIQKIKESSDQTAKIVKTIDEIAMQTNLLALNAAVEAARAGEAGRGFAVVAEEVRNLAQRSAQAAKNTADMIGESVKNAEDGVKISREVAQSFESIAQGTRKVSDLIAEIAAASKEQATGIKQVNDAVGQMDKVTQQNAANAEESASAAEELSSQASELQAMVGQFNINGSTGAALPSIAMAPKARALPGLRNHEVLRKPKIVSAEEVIPLDDEVLKEF